MATTAPASTREMTIIAQDPSVLVGKAILRARVRVPAEDLAEGPWGYRVQVIDYDASASSLYKAAKAADGDDPYAEMDDAALLADPGFHARNAYAIVMRVLARFEFALGRRVAWGFKGHQIKVAPHAFADANAFYAPDQEALLFGYFPGRSGRTVYTCLSHDVVAHEATHALLDGLRGCYLDPSSADQAAFHEGFSDVVAMLSMFALPDVVRAVVDRRAGDAGAGGDEGTVKVSALTPEKLRGSTLLSLGEEFGREGLAIPGRALRQSAELPPDPRYYEGDPEFQESHRRGEILVAAVMNAFVAVWSRRLGELGDGEGKSRTLHRGRVAEEGARVADYLLTMTIRALDYAPPAHLTFGDYLSAMLTADAELRPDDEPFGFRDALLAGFAAYGVTPPESAGPGGLWRHCDAGLTYARTRFESLTRDPVEVFRFLWDNRRELRLVEGVFTRVNSVRPCVRVGPDGFVLRETVAEYEQQVKLRARELRRFRDSHVRPKDGGKFATPEGMPDDAEVTLQGGGTLIFDEYGRLKYHVTNRLDDAAKQTGRVAHLWRIGHYSKGAGLRRRFSAMHRLRAEGGPSYSREAWL